MIHLLLILLALLGTPQPHAHWAGDHAVISWSQPAPATICLWRLHDGVSTLYDCQAYSAGRHERTLPPPGARDLEYQLRRGDGLGLSVEGQGGIVVAWWRTYLPGYMARPPTD